MRFYSTPQSAEDGEITVLAIIETIVAVFLSVWVAVHYQTITHILVGGCLAPLFLLRTPNSIALGWIYLLISGRHFHLIQPCLQPLGYISGLIQRLPYLLMVIPAILLLVAAFLLLSLFLGLISVSFLLMRALATIVSVFTQSPAITLRAIPYNWRQLTWATDFFHPPEVMPGIETIEDDAPEYLLLLRSYSFTKMWTPFYAALDNSTRAHWIATRILVASLAIFICFLWFLPAFLFRLSVKSTSLVYWPLIYVVNKPFSDLSPRETIADLTKGKIDFIRRIVAVLILFLHGISIAMLMSSIVVLNWLYQSGGPVVKVLFDIFLPTDGLHFTMKLWHVAQIANALIVIGLWLYADIASRRIDGGHWQEGTVKRVIGLLQTIQALLTIYTVSCTLAILLRYKLWELLPPIDFQFFPL